MTGRKLDDVRNFLSKLTLTRVINAAKILVSYYFSKISRRAWHWGSPITISIEPTTACNLRCPECPSGLRSFTRATGTLQLALLEKVINQLAKKMIYLIFYFQGEPYLNPHFLEMVKIASKRGLYCMTSTNGHFLDEKQAEETVRSGLDRLIISIDGTTQDTYAAYRREGDLEKVKEGARNIVRWKKILQSKKPYVVFQFLVVAPNEHQIPDIHRLAEEIGVDEVKLKTAQIYDYQQGHPLIPADAKYARYARQTDGTYQLKHKVKDECWKMWHSAVVTWNGTVVPCCFDKDATYVMGNIDDQHFHHIWRGREYEEFRRKVLKGRSEVDMCNNCSEGCRVWT